MSNSPFISKTIISNNHWLATSPSCRHNNENDKENNRRNNDLTNLSQIKKPHKVMKKKKIRFNSISRSNVAVAGYYLQLALMSPILIPAMVLCSISDLIIECWGRYKDWYLAKTLRR